MFSENLARMQAEKGVTNYRMSKEMGVHQTSIANWKKGAARPHPQHLKMLADYFGCTVDELLKED